MTQKELIKTLSNALQESIEEGRMEVRSKSFSNSEELNEGLKEVTFFCVNHFKKTLIDEKKIGKIDLTKTQIEELCKNIYESYYPSSEQEKGIRIDDYNHVSRVFYHFCFDHNYAKTILAKDSASELIGFMINENISSKDRITLDMFSKMAKVLDIDINLEPNSDYQSDNFKQTYNSLPYELSVDFLHLKSSENCIEVLSNNLGEFEGEKLPLSVATKYIIHVEKAVPKSIYVVVKTFMMNSITLRKVNEDGSSSNLGRLKDDSIHTIAELINNKN